MSREPEIAGILETPIYVDDMERAHTFYADFLGLSLMVDGERLRAYSAGPAQTLIVCRRGASTDDVETKSGTIPGHDSRGPAHMAFRIDPAQLEAWKNKLRVSGVGIYSEMDWPRGGHSVYFKDPFGNVLELATPGIWPNY
jgi:catechol 2,3-dioxygenase-like lactoylglutathione lyase family enzyme